MYGCQQVLIKSDKSITAILEYVIPKFGEKPEGWEASGKRVSRGVYETSDGFKINADCNGAANILKKVAVMLGINLSGISRGCLSQPQKVRLWTLQKSPCL
ncbi:transposase [Raphidiopsis curvata NIES-932]|nr:transposase [Raphidiopsis curvata NIES-932]